MLAQENLPGLRDHHMGGDEALGELAQRADGGTVTGAGDYAQGASVTVTAVPKSGYAFVKWTENGQEVSRDASYTFSATGERNLVAVFERKTDETPARTPNLPQTGDDARLGLWLAGLAASLAMLAALTYARRRTIRRR